jgi:hypothetical protein
MSSFRRPRVFDPLDLEIIDRVFEAAWARVEANNFTRDTSKDDERKKALRQWISLLPMAIRLISTRCGTSWRRASPKLGLAHPARSLAAHPHKSAHRLHASVVSVPIQTIGRC